MSEDKRSKRPRSPSYDGGMTSFIVPEAQPPRKITSSHQSGTPEAIFVPLAVTAEETALAAPQEAKKRRVATTKNGSRKVQKSKGQGYPRLKKSIFACNNVDEYHNLLKKNNFWELYQIVKDELLLLDFTDGFSNEIGGSNIKDLFLFSNDPAKLKTTRKNVTVLVECYRDNNYKEILALFAPTAIVRMVARKGGYHNVLGLVEFHHQWQGLLTVPNLIRLLSFDGGYNKLALIITPESVKVLQGYKEKFPEKYARQLEELVIHLSKRGEKAKECFFIELTSMSKACATPYDQRSLSTQANNLVQKIKIKSTAIADKELRPMAKKNLVLEKISTSQSSSSSCMDTMPWDSLLTPPVAPAGTVNVGEQSLGLYPQLASSSMDQIQWEPLLTPPVTPVSTVDTGGQSLGLPPSSLGAGSVLFSGDSLFSPAPKDQDGLSTPPVRAGQLISGYGSFFPQPKALDRVAMADSTEQLTSDWTLET